MSDYQIDFKKLNGLVPVITQDAETGKVLMLAFVNREAFEKTIQTKKAHYWSRSKQRIWCKGETSGNYQAIVDILIDCDHDSLIYQVNQMGMGAACHTGHVSCFYRRYEQGQWQEYGEEKKFNPDDVYC